jgi:hypothetical protein
MYCPSCGSEYREGFSRCADCDVDLVETLSPPPDTHSDPGDLVTILATGDPILLMTAKSLLDEAGIPSFTRGESMQDLFGMGRLGTGFSLVAGPMEIQVSEQRRQEAEELLREADLQQTVEEDDEEDESDREEE